MLIFPLMKPTHNERDAGFTRLDLLALIFIAGFLILLATPVLGNNENKSRAAICASNLKRLTTAWTLYADDNGGRLVMNLNGGLAAGGNGAGQFAPWASGWLDWGTAPDNTNTLFLTSDKFARLARYDASDAKIYKCPEDSFLSKSQNAKGWLGRVRSYSMDALVGGGNIQSGPFDPTTYKQAKLLSDLTIPGPRETSLFLEEHPDSVNDPSFVPPFSGQWEDLPASFHQGSSTVSFTDGHIEVHSWRGSARNVPVTFSPGFLVGNKTNDPDIHWVSYHSSRVSEKSY
ncbi:MAG: xcpT 15 [Verrucomicrobiales bacterium]|nr:xcpT 15 [Verrucomicrobiales bacterium]